MIDFKNAFIGGTALLLSGCGDLLKDIEDGREMQREQVLKQADEAIGRALSAEVQNPKDRTIPWGKSVSGVFDKGSSQFTATQTTEGKYPTPMLSPDCALFDVIVTKHRGSGRTSYTYGQRTICLPPKPEPIR